MKAKHLEDPRDFVNLCVQMRALFIEERRARQRLITPGTANNAANVDLSEIAPLTTIRNAIGLHELNLPVYQMSSPVAESSAANSVGSARNVTTQPATIPASAFCTQMRARAREDTMGSTGRLPLDVPDVARLTSTSNAGGVPNHETNRTVQTGAAHLPPSMSTPSFLIQASYQPQILPMPISVPAPASTSTSRPLQGAQMRASVSGVPVGWNEQLNAPLQYMIQSTRPCIAQSIAGHPIDPLPSTTGTNTPPSTSTLPHASIQSVNQCVVCRDARADVVLIPCGHLVVCSACAAQLRMCPVCRVAIRGFVRTFIA